MSGRAGGKSKVKVHGSKPELPPFLQAMKQQIVANEDAERRERSLRKRKEMASGARATGGGARGGDSANDDDDDGPSVVKLHDDDLTEEEYKKMKRGTLVDMSAASFVNKIIYSGGRGDGARDYARTHFRVPKVRH